MTTSKKYNIYGIGNGIVDTLLEVTDEELDTLGFERGSSLLMGPAEQADLLKKFSDRTSALVSGGSVANSVIIAAQLGASGAMAASLGDDQYGKHYQAEFEQFGITLNYPLAPNEPTGTCAIMITPDAERTMRTSLGVSAELGEQHVEQETLQHSDWAFVEGYLFASPAGQSATLKAAECTDTSECKLAVTFSDPWIVETFREPLEKVVSRADLVFANEFEAQAYTSTKSAEEAFAALQQIVPNCVVTMSEKGCLVKYRDFAGHVTAFPTDPVDLTGAGDAFAGGFLYGITHGTPPQESARRANFIAHKVISQVGARLSDGVLEHWKAAA